MRARIIWFAAVAASLAAAPAFGASKKDWNACKATDPDQVIAACTRVLQSEPNSALAYYNRGQAYVDKEDYDRAIADYTEAIGANPKDACIPCAYNGRAWSHFKLGKAQQGLSDVDKALELEPNNPSMLDTRGNILAALGRREEAIADFRKALAKKPNLQSSRDALKRLGVTR
jgi:tetratricopeptide (TPR) repeat protein